MPLISDKQYTIEDIYQLPDGQRAELINGQMYLMAPHLMFPLFVIKISSMTGDVMVCRIG